MDLKNFKTNIDGDRVYLRIMESSDASAEYAGWLNDPVVNQYLETRVATVPDLELYVREKLESGWALFFGIFFKENTNTPPLFRQRTDPPWADRAEGSSPRRSPQAKTGVGSQRGREGKPDSAPQSGATPGKHIGTVKLEPIDVDKGTAMFGLLIGDRDYWGKGIATEVTNLIVDFAFNTLGLREVTLGVLADNKAAIRVYEKCGFVLDRVEPKAIDHGGVLYDQVWMKKVKN